jgi:biopolymer transport protein TolQ
MLILELIQMDYFRLILQATVVVQLVLVVLLFFSIFSWAIIIFKRKTLKTAAVRTKKFLAVFRNSRNLQEVGAAAKRHKASPLATLYTAGFKELAYLTKTNPHPKMTDSNLESVSRALIKASNKEVARLEKMMSFLATTGSVTPFIGLFGTVWGIMNAFSQLGIQRTANLATVAPGIAEALIATALGLFAAIPAVIAYNYYLSRIKGVISEMEDFSLEFINIAKSLYGT